MTTPRNPTPQGISVLLREAGFAAAGRYRNDEGYRATWADRSLAGVCVQFCAADDGTSRRLLASAALVLTANDWTVATDTHIPRLTVTARKDEQQ